MQDEQTMLNISPESFFTLIGELTGATGGRVDDDHPLPPGPWDPVIRTALRRSMIFGPQPDPWKMGVADLLAQRSGVFGPSPDPWRIALAAVLARHPEIYDAIGGGHSQFGEEISLNPQPLPPRYAFLKAVAQVVVNRAELMQEIAGTVTGDEKKQGIIIVGGYLSRFADDWCGNGFRLKWPHPGPRPHWFNNELTGIDLMILAMQFGQAAREAYGDELHRGLVAASEKLAKEGLSRMQGHRAERSVMQKTA